MDMAGESDTYYGTNFLKLVHYGVSDNVNNHRLSQLRMIK